jgi:hypothetical protein
MQQHEKTLQASFQAERQTREAEKKSFEEVK